jgi:hypothetical protein
MESELEACLRGKEFNEVHMTSCLIRFSIGPIMFATL